MYTTGQFRKKVGIENSTMIRWLREGVIVPEPTEARNNEYSHEEMLIGRVVAPLYLEWSIKAELLREIASFLRGFLSIRKELGYETFHGFYADMVSWRFSNLRQMSSEQQGRDDAELATKLRSYREACISDARKLGVELPSGWDAGEVLFKHLSADQMARMQNYRTLIDVTLSNERDHNLFLALNEFGEHYWWLCSYEEFRKNYGKDASTFICVNLAEALAD